MQSTALASTLPLAASASNTAILPIEEKELYELRIYELAFRANFGSLKDYLVKAYKPALQRLGVNHFMMFGEISQSEPTKIWVLISYPSSSIYVQAQNLQTDKEYLKAAESYNSISPDVPVYTRFESSLLLAFDNFPKLQFNPAVLQSIYELRIYEGYSEDAVNRKIKMFNDEEIALFQKVGLNSVFFGKMLAGKYRPCLVYMLGFENMRERNSNWQDFLKHPEWEAMKNKPEYSNTVSKIRKIFLSPIITEMVDEEASDD